MAIGGPTLTLPYPYNQSPPSTPGISQSVWSNSIFLPRATSFILPPGLWGIQTGAASKVDILDPVTQTWKPVVPVSSGGLVNSDGANYRLSNMTGTAVPIATIGTPGTGYVQATTTVTPSVGGSTWRVLVDGNVASVTIGTDSRGNIGGTGFTLPPLLVIQAPPPGGIPATALAVLTAGVITGVTMQEDGAGYRSPPGVLVVPQPDDPNLGAITIPTLTAVLATPVGALTGIIQTYHGASAAAPTLAIGGAGAAGAATVALVAAAADDTVFVTWLGSVA